MTAPVNIEWDHREDDLNFLSVYDTDGFNQWDASQQLSLNQILELYKNSLEKKSLNLNKNYVTMYRQRLETSLEKPDLSSRLLQLPSFDVALQSLKTYDPEALSFVYELIFLNLSQSHNEILWSTEETLRNSDQPQDFSFKTMGRRRLRQTILKILGHNTKNIPRLASLFSLESSMNDQSQILDALNVFPSPERDRAMDQFAQKWKDNSLVMNKWLSWHASLNHSCTLSNVKELSQSIHFKASNPNKVRALYGAFAGNCWRGFHNQDGSGYSFFAEKILEVDTLNPTTSARLCQSFETWYRLDESRKMLMYKTLENLVGNPKLSKNSFEILKRSLDFEH
jgi:aminopeptidase N